MVEDLIRRARQRFILNETLAQLAFAAAVSVAGFVLLLIFGTRYLEWWTLAIFAVAGIAIGAHRIYHRTPDAYATAVQLDENAHLQDALSTAHYFSTHALPAGSEKFRESQRSQAESVAGAVDLERAVPFLVPRSLYAMAALCVLASGLVALRYGIGHGLDLRAPLTQLLFEDQSIKDAKKAQSLYPKSQKWTDEAQSLLSKLGMGPNPTEPAPTDPDALDKALEQALQSAADPSGKGGKAEGAGKDGQKAGDSASESQDGDPLDNGDEQAGKDDHGQDGSKSGEAGSKSGKNGNSSGSKESLLSRLKDAVSNLLSKSDKEDNPSSQKNQQSAKSEQGGQKGQAGKGAQEKGESQSDADGEPDSDAENGQQAQGKLNSAANQSPAQGGSGIGNQDGSKEIKAAAQLKAMGKISEIIGQRAATVTGETSVEVESGSQRLHTDYSTTSAAHRETDGDVTRDEIPLALQAYVQQYFNEVRKTGAPAKQKAPPKQQ